MLVESVRGRIYCRHRQLIPSIIMQLFTFFTSGIIPMRPRDTAEAHRAATPLELLFDLVSVIAIATATCPSAC